MSFGMMVARDGVEPPTPAFSATLCSVLNNLSDFRWPPRYLRRRDRHENHGWKSWVQKNSPNPRDSSRFKDPHLDFSSSLEQTSISFERRTSRMQPRCGKCFRVRQFSIFKSGHIKRMINNDLESRVRARFRDRTEVLFCAAQEPRVMHFRVICFKW